jgi:hypothetical protein
MNIAQVQPGYRIVRQKMPWIKTDDPKGITISGADFDRANLPMIVGCTGCQHTMTLTSRNVHVDQHTRIWCEQCRPSRFPTRFLDSDDHVSRVASELYRLSQSFKEMMAIPEVHADECRTRWVSRKYYSHAMMACLVNGFDNMADVLDIISARTSAKHLFHSQIKAFIDEVAA